MGLWNLHMEYLLSRTCTGFLFMIPVLLLYYLLLFLFHKKQTFLHITVNFVFCFYLLFVISATGIGNNTEVSFSPEVILSPFRDLLTAPRHFLLNVAALIPFGIFLPLLYKSFRNGKIVAIIGFLFSLCIEVVQMFGWGVSELDDLIANTLGVFLGYCLYGQIRYIHRKDAFKAIQSVSVNDSAQLFFFFAGSFIIMIHV